MIRTAIPRAILICCEGKTEAEYFQILRRVYRIPGFIKVKIVGQIGQHRALVDRACEARAAFARDEGLDEEEVECWAVCDDDCMEISYADLLSYAERHDVRLGFSRPQFECYLLQHFEQSGSVRAEEVFSKLSRHKLDSGGGSPYDEASKSDLEWLSSAILAKPKIIDTAVVNADLRGRQSGALFLTVQDLVKRLRGLQRG